MTGAWRGATVVLGGTDTLGCVATLAPPCAAGELVLHSAPLLLAPS